VRISHKLLLIFLISYIFAKYGDTLFLPDNGNMGVIFPFYECDPVFAVYFIT